MTGQPPLSDFDDVPRFSDGKEPEALRTIGEVATALGIRQHVLRYWEEQFPMLSPIKRSGGRRYYRPEDIALLARIDRLVHQQGYTIKGARKALEAGGRLPDPPASDAPAPVPAQPTGSGNTIELTSLRALRDRLANALADS